MQRRAPITVSKTPLEKAVEWVRRTDPGVLFGLAVVVVGAIYLKSSVQTWMELFQSRSSGEPSVVIDFNFLASGFLAPVIIVAGLGIIGVVLKKPRCRSEKRSGDSFAGNRLKRADLLGLPEVSGDPSGTPERLASRQGPIVRLLWTGGFALVVNAMIGFFVLVWIHEFREGGGWLGFGWMSFLVSAGAVVLVGFAFTFVFLYVLAGILFGPRVWVQTPSRTLVPGERTIVSWRFSRGGRQVRNLRLTLEGKSEALFTKEAEVTSSTFRSMEHAGGMKLDERVFLRSTLFSSDEPDQIVDGQVEVHLPEILPPSFEATNNRIRYYLLIEAGSAVWWSQDLRERFAVFVLPASYFSAAET